MTSPTPSPSEFPDDVDRLLEGIDQVLRDAAATIPPEGTGEPTEAPAPAPGSQAAGDGWGQFDASLRDLKPSCGSIYRTGSEVFVVCERPAGHGDGKCTGEGFQWKSSLSLLRPGQPTAAATPAPEPGPAAPLAQGTPEGVVPEPRTREEQYAELLAELSGNTEQSYRLVAHFGPYRVNPNRIDPGLLNELDASMLASMLRHAADRLDPELRALTALAALEGFACAEPLEDGQGA